jgi:hypothetical protein
MTTTHSSQRASLLAGLRTGGVRSTSVPHTAGPQASFFVSPPHGANYEPSFPEVDETDGLANMMSHGAYISNRYNPPHTAHPDIATAPLAYQQQQWAGVQNHPLPGHGLPPASAYPTQQDMQLQMMQMELMRLQVRFCKHVRSVLIIQLIQAISNLQQYAQLRQDNQQFANQGGMRQNNLPSYGYPAHNALPYGQVPMTAGLAGKFGRRTSHSAILDEDSNALGGRRQPTPNSIGAAQNMVPSKSDCAVSWRNNSNEPALVRDDQLEQSRPSFAKRNRPEPLELSAISGQDPEFVFHRENSESSNDSSSTKSDGEQVSSTPTTPISGNSNGSLSAAREEASKKLFRGLGLGRPSIHVTAPSESILPVTLARVVSQPIRQPRGPPASSEELGAKNFANRIRKKAIGGLGALLEARERREGAPAA